MVFYFFCWKSFICSLGLLEVISLFCSWILSNISIICQKLCMVLFQTCYW
jgi:hypothetical protein